MIIPLLVIDWWKDALLHTQINDANGARAN